MTPVLLFENKNLSRTRAGWPIHLPSEVRANPLLLPSPSYTHYSEYRGALIFTFQRYCLRREILKYASLNPHSAIRIILPHEDERPNHNNCIKIVR